MSEERIITPSGRQLGKQAQAELVVDVRTAMAKARTESERPIIVYDDEPAPPPPTEEEHQPGAKYITESPQRTAARLRAMRAMDPVPHLVLMGNPVLEQVAERVTDFGEPLQKLVADLKARLNNLPYDQKGYGLAAPQLGISKAVAWVSVPDGKVRHEFVMVNPVITQRGKRIRLMEGCLSIPKFFHTIERRYSVTVMYKDETGAIRKQNAKGLLAQVIQHECDHLVGTLIVTYVKERQGRRLAQRCVDHCK